MDDEIITLTDSDGKEEEFELVDLIEYNDDEFIVLYPVNEADGMFRILRVEQDATSEEYDSYVGIDDDGLVQEVFQVFLEKHKDEL